MQVPLSSVLFFASIIVLGIEGLVDALAYPVAVEVPVPVLVPVNMGRFIDDDKDEKEEEEAEGDDNDHTQPLDSEDEEDVEDLLEEVVADAVGSH